MNNAHACLLLVCALLTCAASVTGVTIGDAGPRTAGNQTNATEMAVFKAFLPAEPYETLKDGVVGHAGVWDHGAYMPPTGDAHWEAHLGRCEPINTELANDEGLIEVATDILAEVMAGFLTDTDSYYADARTHLLQVADTTTFDRFDDQNPFQGGNDCILELGISMTTIVEAALLLEDFGYSGWTAADRLDLETWMAGMPYQRMTWASDIRKQSWGMQTIAGETAVLGYLQHSNPTLTDWESSTDNAVTLLAGMEALYDTHMINHHDGSAGDELDSTCYDYPSAGNGVYGVQRTGGDPEALRREGSNDANCTQASIDFDCTTFEDCGSSHQYQQKALLPALKFAEFWRRRGDSTVFEKTTPSSSVGGTMLYDMASFSVGDFTNKDWTLLNDKQAIRFVLGEYEADSDITGYTANATAAFTRGGRDYPYTAITHGNGVSYP